MENFAETHTESLNVGESNSSDSCVKEKSIYLLHLDTPRIVILSSVLIGIVAISFLIGIKLSSPKNSTDDLFSARSFSHEISSNRASSEIDDLFSSDDSSAKKSSGTDFMDSLARNENSQNSSTAKTQDPVAKQAQADIFEADSVNVVAPPRDSTPVTPVAPTRAVSTQTTTQSAPTGQQATPQPQTRPVSAVPAQTTQNTAMHQIDRSGYAIQVCSLDTLDKAKREENMLKEMNYKTYIDSAVVNGKSFYRVRIGPFEQKSEALLTLNQIQQRRRYEESYMIEE